VRFSIGILGLTKDQASDRVHNLKEVGKGQYQILRPVDFIAGEVVGYDGPVTPALLMHIEPIGTKKAQDPAPGNPKEARIKDLEAKGEGLTPDEAAELLALHG